MNQWADFEKGQLAAMAGPKKDLITCLECGSHWFETVEGQQFDKNLLCSLSQRPPAVSETFFLFRCIRCGELHEPPVIRHVQNAASKDYDQLLDELEKDKSEHGGRRAQASTLPAPGVESEKSDDS